MFEKFIFSNDIRYRLFRHLLYWMFFAFLMINFRIANDEYFIPEFKRVITYLLYYIATTIILLYVIIPFYLKKNKIFSLFIALIVFLFFSLLGQHLIEYFRTQELLNYSTNYWSEFTFKFRFCISAYAVPCSFKIVKLYYTNHIRLIEIEKLEKENKIKILTEQLNPHFLFNAFATIRSLIGENDDNAKKIVNEISEYYRYALVNNDKDSRALQEEVNSVKNYVEIQKIRFKSEINVSFNIDDDSRYVMIPFLAIQILVENAIKYGSRNNENSLEIEIKSRIVNNQLKIVVTNSGLIKNNESKENSTKTGLNNLKKRLDILYPNNNSFKLYEKENKVFAEIIINYL